MNILYFDCFMGAAGDMLTGALIDLFDDKTACVQKLNGLGIPGVEYKLEESSKCGITGSHIHVLVNGHEEGVHHHHEHEEGHTHSTMEGISHIVRDHLKVNEKVKNDILSVYNIIADAESKVHGVKVEEIHFHEVGAMDAVADISAVCFLLDELKIQKIYASPINVGSGTVHCAHGILPVPAPATANILEGIPVYSGNIQSELCTPTGAALLKYFASDFCSMPLMKIKRYGYGMGTKNFETANCVRAVLGESVSEKKDKVFELSCNIDDMSGEKIGFAMDRLFEAGSLDVWTVSAGMKKNRPGVILNCLVKEENLDEVVRSIFVHTTTLGVRKNELERFVLDRKIEEFPTKYGAIKKKISEGYGITREKFEFDDLASAAKKAGKSILEVEKELKN